MGGLLGKRAKDATEFPTMHKTVTQNKVLQDQHLSNPSLDRPQQPLSSNYWVIRVIQNGEILNFWKTTLLPSKEYSVRIDLQNTAEMLANILTVFQQLGLSVSDDWSTSKF